MKNFNLKKSFLESSFLRVLNIIKKNPNTYLYTIILDFIFLALIMFIGKYVGSLIPQDTQQIMDLFKTQANLLLFVVAYPIIYYLLIIFVYSITKLSILNLINRLYEKYEKSKFTLNGLGRFYLLNILLFVIFFFTALSISGILALILTTDFLKYTILILAVPFLFFAYSTINICHTLFIKNKKEKIIRTSFKIAFSKINRYGAFVLWNIAITFIYLIFYNLIHLVFRLFIFTNQEILASYGSIYLKIFNIISIIFIYLIIAFNRIYFCERIDKNVL